VPHSGGQPASLIQIPKFSERPSIVPHEVLHGLHVGAKRNYYFLALVDLVYLVCFVYLIGKSIKAFRDPCSPDSWDSLL
jgi:hypothetical protein